MITIYTKEGCEGCQKSKQALIDSGATFLEVDVSKDINNLVELRDRLPGVQTVPQVFDGDEYVGGYPELKQWLGEKYFLTHSSE